MLAKFGINIMPDAYKLRNVWNYWNARMRGYMYARMHGMPGMSRIPGMREIRYDWNAWKTRNALSACHF